MTFNPVIIYRPVRTADGSGGFSESLSDGVTVYAALQVDDGKVSAVIEASEDVRLNDLVELGEGLAPVPGLYRVTSRLLTPNRRFARVELTKTGLGD